MKLLSKNFHHYVYTILRLVFVLAFFFFFFPNRSKVNAFNPTPFETGENVSQFPGLHNSQGFVRCSL